jgi:hypothetical protein
MMTVRRAFLAPTALTTLLISACSNEAQTADSNAIAPRAASIATAPCENSIQFESLILAHAKRYPNMRVVDALKLLHQAAMGSEHAITDTAAAVQWMDREWSSMGQGPDEPLVDTLGVNGKYARVHLRPFQQRGGDKRELLQAFIQTGSAPGDTTILACALQNLETLAMQKQIPWTPDSIRAASAAWRASGYRAVRHSEEFRSAHRPAYRILERRLIDSLLR